jgi:RHS repeat-associated protein
LAEIVSFRSRLGYRGELTFDSLLYLRNRNDQPSTGQFTSRDPIDGTPGTTGLANPYHYVNNSPLMSIDPSGLFAVEDSMFAQLREAFNDPSWDHAGPNAYGTGVLGTFMNCLDDHNSTTACLNVVANPLYGTVASFGNCLDGGSSAYQCANQGFNPAYQLLVHGDRCITGETAITGSMSRAAACVLAALDTVNTVGTAVGGARALTNGVEALGARPGTAAETGSRGLSNLGGIIEETGTNSAGGRIFTSTGDIAQKDFGGIVNNGLMRGDQVSILAGAHGAADGRLIADASMFADDFRAFGDLPGVHVYNVASMTPSEIGAVLNGPGTVVGGFCNSGACLAPFRR